METFEIDTGGKFASILLEIAKDCQPENREQS